MERTRGIGDIRSSRRRGGRKDCIPLSRCPDSVGSSTCKCIVPSFTVQYCVLSSCSHISLHLQLTQLTVVIQPRSSHMILLPLVEVVASALHMIRSGVYHYCF